MEEHSKKDILLIFLATIVILSSIFLYEDGLDSPVDKACPQDITCIELVVQFHTPNIYENYNNVFFDKSGEKFYLFNSKYLSNPEICPLPFNYCPVIINIMKLFPDSSAKHIISIIQKMNRWHQSSDDEASHFIFS